MKKVFSMMLILLAMSFTMVSCSDDDDEPSSGNPLVGTWVKEQTDETVTVTFKSDQTGTVDFYDHDTEITTNQKFEYQYNADQQELYILGSCSLSGTYDVIITATKMTLKGYDYRDKYVNYVFEKR